MKILQINTVYPNGSTGKIAHELYNLCKRNFIECRVAYRYAENNSEFSDTITTSSWLNCHLHNRISRYTMLQGIFSYFHTLRFLKKVSEYKPDVIHLHNLHGSYINIPLLFGYIKKNNIKVVWTLHDCWSFTGYCPHFDMIGCDKWKTGCYSCPQYRDYPKSLFDNSKFMYRLKSKWFTGVENMTIVTPSKWLASLVKESYLRDYPVKVINNGIDLNIFKPTESDFRKKYALENKYVVLGVAFGWGKRKGLDVFIELAKRLDKEKYKIVLVGTDDNVDRLLPENIISIHRTQNQTELAEIYTAADVFANPTREENYPTVNMESIACGTPVVTFNTGGSPEIIDKGCGTAVAKNDTGAMYNEIIRICATTSYSEAACLEKAQSFDKNIKFKEYISLYEELNEQN